MMWSRCKRRTPAHGGWATRAHGTRNGKASVFERGFYVSLESKITEFFRHFH